MSTIADHQSDAYARARRAAAMLATSLSAGFGLFFIATYAQTGFVEPFTDAMSYLAAGERLIAGHDLYALGPGDRSVLIVPSYWTSPLLYPPPIAILWVPLAALHEIGLAVWVVLCAAALLIATWLVASRSLLAAALVLALSPAIGEQLAVANVNSLFVGGLLVAWLYRRQPWIGALLGVMASIKGLPLVLAAWLIGRRHAAALVAMVLTSAAVLILAAVVVGMAPFARYLEVVRDTPAPSPMSLNSITGTWVTSPLVVLGGSLLAIILGLRGHERSSFAAAVIAMTIGTPSLYPSGLVLLLPAIRVIPAGIDGRLGFSRTASVPTEAMRR